jgi:peptide chain release factor subunit 1
MAQSAKEPAASLAQALDRLARFRSDRFPVVSLYLDARPDGKGRDHYQPFARKELAARARTFPLRSSERESFDRDAERIQKYLSDEVRPSANGIALFACSGEDGFFEGLQLDAPITENRISVSPHPHLYPLARIVDEYPRYAVVVADTKSARIYVFGRGRQIDREEVESPSMERTSVGGWSQMRYQRHVDKLRKDHAKELVDVLVDVVEKERAEHVILSGDEVIVPLIRGELPKALAAKVIDTVKLDRKQTSEAEILEATMTALRELDARTDAERVEQLLGEYRAGGLGVTGREETKTALEMGQVDELLVSATIRGDSPGSGDDWADELVVLAKQTDAQVRFIEDPALLRPIEDVGAFLRYRVAPPARNFPGQEKTTPSDRSRQERA